MKTSGMLIVVVTAFVFAGCMPSRPAATSNESDEKEQAEEREHAEERVKMQDPRIVAAAALVKVVPGGMECPTEVLGVVDVHEPVKSTAEGLDLLRRRAALLGAEAVTGVEFEHGEGGAEKTHLSGTAVRCHDLLRGRKYDVLGKIEATAEMGHEEDAIPLLNKEARAKGANLILEVHFEHGEGDRTKVSGTAVHAYYASRDSQ